MRNFCSEVKHVLAIDVSVANDKSVLQKDACQQVILAAMQAYPDSLTSGESFTLDSFGLWYEKRRQDFEDGDFGGIADSWIYVNLNNGTVVVFHTFFRDGADLEVLIDAEWMDEEVPSKLLEALRQTPATFQ